MFRYRFSSRVCRKSTGAVPANRREHLRLLTCPGSWQAGKAWRSRQRSHRSTMRSCATGLSTWSSRSPAPIRRRQDQLRNDTHARSQGFCLTGAREALAPRLGSGHLQMPQHGEGGTWDRPGAACLNADGVTARSSHAPEPTSNASHNKSASPLERAKFRHQPRGTQPNKNSQENGEKMTGMTATFRPRGTVPGHVDH